MAAVSSTVRPAAVLYFKRHREAATRVHETDTQQWRHDTKHGLGSHIIVQRRWTDVPYSAGWRSRTSPAVAHGRASDERRSSYYLQMRIRRHDFAILRLRECGRECPFGVDMVVLQKSSGFVGNDQKATARLCGQKTNAVHPAWLYICVSIRRTPCLLACWEIKALADLKDTARPSVYIKVSSLALVFSHSSTCQRRTLRNSNKSLHVPFASSLHSPCWPRP